MRGRAWLRDKIKEMKLYAINYGPTAQVFGDLHVEVQLMGGLIEVQYNPIVNGKIMRLQGQIRLEDYEGNVYR